MGQGEERKKGTGNDTAQRPLARSSLAFPIFRFAVSPSRSRVVIVYSGNPSTFRPASLIMLGFQGGSHTISTLASRTPGSERICSSAS